MPSLASLAGLLNSRPRIVTTADMSSEGLAALERIGPTRPLGWAAGEWFVEPPRLRAAVADAQVLVAGYEPIGAELIAAAPRLAVIASVRGAPGANVDVAAATAHGIAVLHTVGRTDHGVAEFTVAVALAMARRLVPATSWMTGRPAGFDPGPPAYRGTVWGNAQTSPQLAFTGFELNGRTLGIVGFGAIGRVVAQKFAGFGMRLLAHDPYVDPREMRNAGVEPAPLDQLLEQSTFVTLHARLGVSTRHLIGAPQFRLMPAGSYLINSGRAGLVDGDALLDALDSGQLSGAALDVFDTEPPDADDRLAAHPRVLATPHLAAWTIEMQQRHTASIIDSLERLRRGEPANLTNPEVLATA